MNLTDFLAASPTFRALNPQLFGHAAPAGPAVERERDLHDDIEAECRARGLWYIHSRMDRPTTTGKGVPDFVVFGPGWVLCVEAKAGKGKQTIEQRDVEVHLRKLGHRYALVRSLDEFRKAVLSESKG